MNHIQNIFNFQKKIAKKSIIDSIFINTLNSTPQRPIVLYGAGALGEDFKYFLNSFSLYPIAFCESRPQRTKFCGLPIISVEELLRKLPECLILISTKTYAAQIKMSLLEAGIPEEQIVFPFHLDETDLSYCSKVNAGSLLRKFKIDDSDDVKWAFLEHHKEKINSVFDMLADDKSKNLFTSKFATLLNFDCINCYSSFIKNHSEPVKKFGLSPAFFSPASPLISTGDGIENYFYFNNDVFTLDDHSVYVDAGAYTGDTIRALIKTLDGKKLKYKEIIAFEPDHASLSLLKRTISTRPGMTFEQKGLWSYTGKHNFVSSDAAELPGGNSFTESGNIEIDVIKLDEYLNERKVDFIKIDTPGGMIDALHGAASTIGRYAPKLALGIYHRIEDIFEIPFLIKQLNPNYKLYLRHNQWLINETDLFAVHA